MASLAMSTAQNTASTFSATPATSEALATFIAPTAAGTEPSSVHRPATASAYALPAELGLAATAVTSNHGCSASSATNRWPTMPVAPRTPTLSLFAISDVLADPGAVPAALAVAGAIVKMTVIPMPLMDGLRVVASSIHGYGVVT